MTDTINWYLENFGTLVSNDHYEARLKVCGECPSFGKVRVAGELLDGCTECGCPAATKPKVNTYFNPRELRKIKVECPLGKWAETDRLFNQ